MATIGMPPARAWLTKPLTSLVVFCELKTSTLICLPAIWLLMVALSSAVRSSPSAIALMRLGDVRRFRPSAGARSSKILSVAPTGVPAYLALMAAMRSE